MSLAASSILLSKNKAHLQQKTERDRERDVIRMDLYMTKKTLNIVKKIMSIFFHLHEFPRERESVNQKYSTDVT